MDTNNTLSGTATAAPVVNVEGATSMVPGYELCAICHQSVTSLPPSATSKTGLAVHQRRAHPVEYHAGHQVEKRTKFVT